LEGGGRWLPGKQDMTREKREWRIEWRRSGTVEV
jgi:hypothetical protein